MGPRSESGGKNTSGSAWRQSPSYCQSHCSAIGAGSLDRFATDPPSRERSFQITPGTHSGVNGHAHRMCRGRSASVICAVACDDARTPRRAQQLALTSHYSGWSGSSGGPGKLRCSTHDCLVARTTTSQKAARCSRSNFVVGGKYRHDWDDPSSVSGTITGRVRRDIYRIWPAGREERQQTRRQLGRPPRLPHAARKCDQACGWPMLTSHATPNWSTHMPNSSPHICFSRGTDTLPLADNASQ
jgi:hypothetical protein